MDYVKIWKAPLLPTSPDSTGFPGWKSVVFLIPWKTAICGNGTFPKRHWLHSRPSVSLSRVGPHDANADHWLFSMPE